MNFVQLEGIYDVDNSWCILVLLDDVIRRNLDLVASFLDVTSFDLEARIVVDKLVWIGVRAELVARDQVFKHFHLSKFCLFNTIKFIVFK